MGALKLTWITEFTYISENENWLQFRKCSFHRDGKWQNCRKASRDRWNVLLSLPQLCQRKMRSPKCWITLACGKLCMFVLGSPDFSPTAKDRSQWEPSDHWPQTKSSLKKSGGPTTCKLKNNTQSQGARWSEPCSISTQWSYLSIVHPTQVQAQTLKSPPSGQNEPQQQPQICESRRLHIQNNPVTFKGTMNKEHFNLACCLFNMDMIY